MKKSNIILGLMAIAAVIFVGCTTVNEKSSEAYAESTVTAAAGSIVYFDLDRVVDQYDMANELSSEVEAKVATIQKEVNRRQKNLEDGIADFQNKLNKGLMTSVTAQAQQQKLQEQEQAFQQFAQQKQAEILEEQQVMVNRIIDAIKTYVEKLNAEKDYAMILTNQSGAPVIAADASLDITNDIVEGLNKEYIKAKKAE